MIDSFGDGWNGNILTLNDVDYVLDDHNPDCTDYYDCSAQGLDDQTATVDICYDGVDFGSTTWSCGGGSYTTEVSWSMSCSDGQLYPEDGSAASCDGSGFLSV
jgi:hypothetical protein